MPKPGPYGLNSHQMDASNTTAFATKKPVASRNSCSDENGVPRVEVVCCLFGGGELEEWLVEVGSNVGSIYRLKNLRFRNSSCSTDAELPPTYSCLARNSAHRGSWSNWKVAKSTLGMLTSLSIIIETVSFLSIICAPFLFHAPSPAHRGFARKRAH